MVKMMLVEVPDAGTLPVPVQPVQTYCLPGGPFIGEVTDSFIEVPESYQLLEGEGEP
jgi:hypothetical protein